MKMTEIVGPIICNFVAVHYAPRAGMHGRGLKLSTSLKTALWLRQLYTVYNYSNTFN